VPAGSAAIAAAAKGVDIKAEQTKTAKNIFLTSNPITDKTPSVPIWRTPRRLSADAGGRDYRSCDCRENKKTQ
jgi:hypothetical protein